MFFERSDPPPSIQQASSYLRCCALSPYSVIFPSTVPALMVSPSLTRISDSTPVIDAATSIVILSVSISTSGSSTVTGSPTRLNHRPTDPRVTDFLIFGTQISVTMRVILYGSSGSAGGTIDLVKTHREFDFQVRRFKCADFLCAALRLTETLRIVSRSLMAEIGRLCLSTIQERLLPDSANSRSWLSSFGVHVRATFRVSGIIGRFSWVSLTVFMVSWRNPDASCGHFGWDDYVEHGAMRAIEISRSISGADKVNVVGWCVGGTILSSALAILRTRGDESVASVTMKILGLSLALLLFGAAYGPALAAPVARSPKTRARGCRTPTDEGDAANRPSGSTSLIVGEIGAICVRSLVEPLYPRSRISRTAKKPGMTSTYASWLSSRSVYS